MSHIFFIFKNPWFEESELPYRKKQETLSKPCTLPLLSHRIEG